jgi:hypothetical protein
MSFTLADFRRDIHDLESVPVIFKVTDPATGN